MRVSYKAAFLSAVVFPGVGHLYLKRYLRALVIMLPACAGFGYVIWSVTVAALHRLDDGMIQVRGGAPNLQELSDIAGLNALTMGPYSEAIVYGIICIWLFAVIDAYRIGKQRELQDEATSR